MSRKRLTATALVASLAATAALADAGHGSKIGKPGKPAQVDRTITVRMDEMKYDPATIVVEPGETIRFRIENVGTVVHEFNIGRPETWDGHADEMMAMMDKGMMTVDTLDHAQMMMAGMMHDDANSVLLEPGDTGEVVWTFPKGGKVGFACNVPGHRESGMVGDFRINQGS